MASDVTLDTDGTSHPRGRSLTRWTFGLGSLLFMIAQIAFCLGLLQRSWFMGIFAAAIFIPASVRASRMAENRRVLGAPMSFDERAAAYTRSVLVMTFCAYASYTTWFLATLVVPPGVICIIGGLIAAGGVFWWLLRKLW
jgi:hypothetical protein